MTWLEPIVLSRSPSRWTCVLAARRSACIKVQRHFKGQHDAWADKCHIPLGLWLVTFSWEHKEWHTHTAYARNHRTHTHTHTHTHTDTNTFFLGNGLLTLSIYWVPGRKRNLIMINFISKGFPSTESRFRSTGSETEKGTTEILFGGNFNMWLQFLSLLKVEKIPEMYYLMLLNNLHAWRVSPPQNNLSLEIEIRNRNTSHRSNVNRSEQRKSTLRC